MTDPQTAGGLAALGRSGRIGRLVLGNRMIASPLHTGLCDQRGRVTDEVVEHYRQRGAGGAGLVMTEYMHVDDDASKTVALQLTAAGDEAIPGLRRIADAVHAGGAFAGAQLSHAGRQRMLPTGRVVAPSVVPWPAQQAAGGPLPEALSRDEIQRIVASFGAAAARVVAAGFDLVEVHGGHGYLVAQFLSGRTNRRTDEYGGGLSGRQRFLREVVEAVRDAVGPSFPVSVRLSHTEFLPEGIGLPETIETASMLEALGVAALDISAGNHQTRMSVQSMYLDRGFNVEAASLIRTHVGIPVSVVGSLNAPATAASALEGGAVDFVRLGRALLADPDYPRKVLEGAADDIRPCIRCNECLERGLDRGAVVCSVNTSAGKGVWRNTASSAEPKLRLLVIGGGPAGLEACRVASDHGHDVTLFEQGELGGVLADLRSSPSKQDLADYRRYLVHAVEGRVSLVTQRLDSASAQALPWDAAIVAVGAVPCAPAFSGAGQARALDARAAFVQDVGERVIVQGGSQNAADAALHLLERGCSVTLVSSAARVASDLGGYSHHHLMGRLHAFPQLTILTNAHVCEFSRGAYRIRIDGASEDVTVAADAIVTSDYAPSAALADLLPRDDRPVLRIGDCVRPRRIFDAVHEADRAVRELEARARQRAHPNGRT